MQARVEFSALREALASAVRAAGGKSAILPITRGVLLRVVDQSLVVQATNLQVEITRRIPLAAIPEPVDGAVVIGAEALHDYLAYADGTFAELSLGDRLLLDVRVGRGKAEFKGVDADQFPTIQEPGADALLRLDADEFKNALARLEPTAAQESARSSLHAIKIELRPGEPPRLVGAQGIIVAYRDIHSALAPDSDRDFLVPLPNVAAIRGVLGKGAVVVTASEGRLSFTQDNLVISSLLLNEAYPSWRRVIPGAPDTIAVVSQKSLLRVVTGAVQVTRSRDKFESSMVLDIEDGMVRVSGKAQDQVATITEDVTAEVAGPARQILINALFFQTCLAQFPDGNVALNLTAGHTPLALTRAPNSGSAREMYLIMPLSAAPVRPVEEPTPERRVRGITK